MKTLSAVEVSTKLKAQEITLVDIRELDEYSRENIRDANHIPLSAIKEGSAKFSSDKTVVFHCKTGNRTAVNSETLGTCVAQEAFVLEGGLDAWKAAGFDTRSNNNTPIELNRQVQITAGGLVLFGVLLGLFVHPAFVVLSGFIGAGLVYAGVSGTCGLAKLLSFAPWNKIPTVNATS